MCVTHDIYFKTARIYILKFGKNRRWLNDPVSKVIKMESFDQEIIKRLKKNNRISK